MLLACVLDRWPGDDVLLGLDATTLGERFVVLAISVLYRGCAIPVAWAIVPAGQKGAWRPVWERLLLALRAGVPRRDLAVLVLADRGLHAKWLFRAMLAQNWRPFLRVNTARQHHRQQPRLTGVFRRGWSRLLTALLTAAPLPLGAFLPEPLPHRAPLPTTDLADEPSEPAA